MSAATAAPLLRAEGLSVAFQGARGWMTAVEDISFALSPGETLALVGESGSGKSVTAMAVARLHAGAAGTRATGHLRWRGAGGDEADLLALRGEALRRVRGREIAVVFQDPGSALDPLFTIGDQIAETLRHLRGLGRREAAEQAVALLDLVGIPDPPRRAGEYPHQLSGGMRQRAVIALALAGEPRLLIADEPTTALDVTIQAQIVDLLRDLQSREGMAMIFVSHDLGLVAGLAHRICVLYAGQVVEEGPAAEVLAAPRHPYTRALLDCIPSLEGEPPRGIPGLMPNPLAPPPYCRFAERCAMAVPACREGPVPLLDAAPGRRSRCIRWEEVA
ncbi:peptide/nickel transport system ATP-binding protein [Roseomonas rosea]|uniref:Peptide/nickel transport system ATP-binding protein n=1 Tax=Muricoccus roseus TaxID=198092 RepID=A0A1M6N132_9PROT|nr:ABC transporter ATP-binding protein [Roseomonas rosea]SHJ89342.1 peptide/nickel transport system ATP-binding protein [Roseomonas rosea]